MLSRQHASSGIGSRLHANGRQSSSCIGSIKGKRLTVVVDLSRAARADDIVCNTHDRSNTCEAKHTCDTDQARLRALPCLKIAPGFTTTQASLAHPEKDFDEFPKGQKVLTVYVVVVIEASVVRHIVCSTHAKSG